ncbi:LysE family transporter [Candidatus Berkelbacteria bacterium]|nr:LysE family transporter [Candidatus Berkelbacteria bacterium]
MEYLPEFLTVALVHLLAVMSPGPDFALVTRNSLVYSRRTGVYSAVGIALGILVHIAYSLAGIGLVISKSILLFTTIKWIGALYLIWIGWQALKTPAHDPSRSAVHRQADVAPRRAVTMGFLTNVLNPKATLFFLALFTQVIDPHTPLAIQGLYAAEMFVVTFLWFAIVANAFSHRFIKDRVTRSLHWVERTMGAILIALGLKVAFSRE